MSAPEGYVALTLNMESCATREQMNANLEATLARGYTRINEYLGQFSGTVSICGAGPSLARTLPELSGDILAINSAIGYLLDHGIAPRWAMIWDASPLCQAFAVPHPDVTYLVAARCDPSVFERLEGCRQIVWHAGGDHNIMEILAQKAIQEPTINGGSAGVTRALFMAYALGYRDIHIHGADSSYSDSGATHIRGSLVPEKRIDVLLAGKQFVTTPEYAAQIEELKMIWPSFHSPDYGARITVHGDGLMPYAASLLAA
jgi:hypothetical protein